jgi:hypothetical protein
METVIITAVGCFQAVAVAVIGGLFARESRQRKAAQNKTEERATIRAEESGLSMRFMSASIELAVATALAVKEGKANGKMDAAVTKAEKAQTDYYAFVNRVAAAQISKE